MVIDDVSQQHKNAGREEWPMCLLLLGIMRKTIPDWQNLQKYCFKNQIDFYVNSIAFAFFCFAEVVCQVKPGRWGDNKNQLPDLHWHSSSGHQHEWLQKGMCWFQQPIYIHGFFVWYFCSPDCVKHTVILNGCCCSGCGEDRRESLSRRMRRSGGWRCVQGPSVRTFCLPKLPHTLLSHSLQLTSGSKWIMSVEGQSINHLYCKSAENYCK